MIKTKNFGHWRFGNYLVIGACSIPLFERIVLLTIRWSVLRMKRLLLMFGSLGTGLGNWLFFSATCLLLSAYQFQCPSRLNFDSSFLANLQTTKATDALPIIKNQIFSLLHQSLRWADLCAPITPFAYFLINDWLRGQGVF